MTDKRLVSIEKAAAYLSVHDKTIRRWISEGKLTGYRVGTKTLRVDLNEVDGLAVPIVTVASFD